MKHFLTPALIAVAFLSTAIAAPRTLEQIRTSGTLRIATEGAFPPFNYFEQKNLVGFEYDLGNAIAQAMGLKASWSSLAFDSLLISLNDGRYDYVIASHAITPERQKAVDFVNPHYCSTVNIVAKNGGPLDRKALAGKTVGAQVGTAQLPILRAIPGIKNVLTFPNDQVALSALQSGRIDAWSSNGPVVAYMLKATNQQNAIKIGEVISNERNASAVAKGNTALHDAINTALAKVMKNGTYAKLSDKWFGTDIRCK